jgi:hypothetical protein
MLYLGMKDMKWLVDMKNMYGIIDGNTEDLQKEILKWKTLVDKFP